jgi:2,3-bisphosphoglycerate-independent phosphoglycerate mutase
MQKHRPVMLVVLDGWGWREDPADNAVRQARTPDFDEFWSTCPHALLQRRARTSACLRVKWGIPKSDISI